MLNRSENWGTLTLALALAIIICGYGVALWVIIAQPRPITAVVPIAVPTYGFKLVLGLEKAELVYCEPGVEDRVMLWLDVDGVVHSESHAVPLDKLLAVFDIVATWSTLNK